METSEKLPNLKIIELQMDSFTSKKLVRRGKGFFSAEVSAPL